MEVTLGVEDFVNRRALVAACSVGSFAVLSCVREPVAWEDVSYAVSASPDPDSIRFTGEAVQLPLPDSAACRGSIRVARAGKSFFASWWSIRHDSSASLQVSRSDDGGQWAKPVIADGSDRSRRGCARPAASIAADIGSGYVHLGYFIEPASGAGVFSAHTMDRGLTFHSPVPIVFGSRLAETAVAAEGARVAVAYEDPNSARPQVFVALSRTMGHTFELRVRASGENTNATNPAVKLRGTKLEAVWTERSSADPLRERHASRIGIWK